MRKNEKVSDKIEKEGERRRKKEGERMRRFLIKWMTLHFLWLFCLLCLVVRIEGSIRLSQIFLLEKTSK